MTCSLPQFEPAPSAISAGIESPMAEALATLPPSVPELRIGSDAKRSQVSRNSGQSPTSAANARSSVTAAPMLQPLPSRRIACSSVDVAGVEDVAQRPAAAW